LNKQVLLILTLLIGFSSFAQDGRIDFTAEEQKWIDAHPVVYHGYDPEWKPIGFVDDNGKYAGISADYLNLIGPRIGIEFKPYEGIESWSHSLELLHNGDILFLPALAQNEDRNKFLDFTDTYSSYSFVIVSLKDGNFIGGMEDLDTKKVVTPENYFITGLLE